MPSRRWFVRFWRIFCVLPRDPGWEVEEEDQEVDLSLNDFDGQPPSPYGVGWCVCCPYHAWGERLFGEKEVYST